ncbi:iron(III) transport system ATP-binding protein [Sporomusaceae bacterium BoRhaA]|uniref:ABC transporter ATP-binding protein n=1 Tax=Pelorhabdus rhamnosifermentans TaxID=2772457 RepID=UPI001C06165A|nr:ABC transporter ATP-binding protein [Pelorhabdus rhamnosifermentans]MBU2703546.1 iron(III) transport system ATP-binding protein [Pelorhabdus rhamnosifermentans]
MDLEICNIRKSFGPVQALKPTCLAIKQGHFLTLLGPSGCGKTTLLRLIAGLETPDAGEFYVDSECIYSFSNHINKSANRRNFGMVFQDFSLWPHMTVFENIAFGLRARGETTHLKQRVQQAVDIVRLQGMEKRYPHQLSGGQQQRVAFARAIVTKPQLILFDEPLSALDAVLREEMRYELMNLVHNTGFTALYVTHDQTEAMSMSDEIAVMNDGQILQVGKPENIYQHPNHPFVASFIGKSNWLEENKTVFRPEHIQWEPNACCHTYEGTVERVSYLGDRYEIYLSMTNKHIWTAYRNKRMTVGDKVPVFVSPQDIQHIPTYKEDHQ